MQFREISESALGRAGLVKQGYEDFIQTDSAVDSGNSGGGLIHLKARLVGINTAIISPAGGNVGICFAMLINMARKELAAARPIYPTLASGGGYRWRLRFLPDSGYARSAYRCGRRPRTIRH